MRPIYPAAALQGRLVSLVPPVALCYLSDGAMHDKTKPTCVLAEVQALVLRGEFDLTNRAAMDASRLGFDRHDVQECICALAPHEFDMSDRATNPEHAGTTFDVYLTVYSEVGIYAKFTVGASGRVRVISFHRGD